VDNGVERLHAAPDGSGAVWWLDETGDESGRWMFTSFDGGESRPLLDVPEAWAEGIGLGRTAVAVALSDGEGYRVWASVGGEPPRVLAKSDVPLGISREFEYTQNGMSADGSILCVRTAEDGGNIILAALRALDTRTGAVLGELRDPGLHLRVCAWSPVPGDRRLAIAHEREGWIRPAVWNPTTGERRDLQPGLPGLVDVWGWWPDGSALLAVNIFEGRAKLYRMDPDTGAAELVLDPEGWVSEAAVRPDGSLWARTESGATPPAIRDGDGREILVPSGERAPEGRPYRSVAFENPAGDRIHGFVVTPEGPGPFPIVMSVHGGPDWAYSDEFYPEVQAFVEHGFAVGLINYRGSTGYGVAFANALKGNVGFPETEDIVAGLDALIADGTADPDRAVVQGWSWGGYISLFAAGTRPDRFAAAIGGIPVADYVACHDDANPSQQRWDLALLGGHPSDLPELYERISPITYIDRVRVPILIVAGENDSACPIRQVHNYVNALSARGGTIETLIYDAGHHAMAVEDHIRFTERQLAFLHRYLPGVPAPR
jgi:dipeptidyl aminopeptidase/acylaminoacyl peptidase